MSERKSLSNRLAVVSLAVGLFIGPTLTSPVEGVGALPPSPPPCAADGTCRPNRDSWGFNRTRWRRWPGEEVPAPTPAEEEEEDIRELPEIERPSPRQEDIRGPLGAETAPAPAVPAPTGEPTTMPEQTTPAPQGAPQQLAPPQPLDVPDPFEEADPFEDEGQEQLPEQDEAFPDFDLQGGVQPELNREDPPPALPDSLSQLQWSQPASAAASTSSVAAPHEREAPLEPVTADRGTAQVASYEQPPAQADQSQSGSIQLVNPAAANLVQPSDGQFQQAIYYEASDLPPTIEQQ